MKNNEYDAIIIGAGIGGLVCGCYLAKAGMKVLMVEKNAKPGGYCTSFTSNGFKFDAFVHSLGSLKKGEIIANVLDDLDISKRIKFKRYNPSDLVITPDYKIYFWNEIEKTVQEFQSIFPKESKAIKKFFSYLKGMDNNHAELRKPTFNDLLNIYFKDARLKAIISLFTLGNVGLPSSKISAFTAVKFYKQFMLDGGYYPTEGMQFFSDSLASRFRELGGTLLMHTTVDTIMLKKKEIRGVLINEKKYFSKYVVSNCDARQTFLSLVGEKKVEKEFVKMLKELEVSLSMFILYLGVDKNFSSLPKEGVNTWFLPSYDLEGKYQGMLNNEKECASWFMIRLLQDKKSLLMFANAPYKSMEYWRLNREYFIREYIQKIERIVPNISRHIVHKNAATPNTLQKLTLNYNGASYGWAGVPSQFALPGLAQSTSIDNLYLAGHWTTLAQGVPGVTHVGKNTAEIILRKEKRFK